MSTAPHLLTTEQFCATAFATKLTNHGRRWQVSYGENGFAFSDEANADAAVVDVHRALVNNALYLNLHGIVQVHGELPELPPARVLEQYPDVVAMFPELGLAKGAQTCLQL